MDEELSGLLIYIKREIRVAEQTKDERRRRRTPAKVAAYLIVGGVVVVF